MVGDMKAPRGQGYIAQRKEDGLWVGQLSLGKDANGKRRRVAVYAHTQGECQAKLNAAKAQVGLGLERTDQTLAEYLDWWLETVVRPAHKDHPNTAFGYANLIRLYIKPKLGHIKLTKVSPVHVEQLQAELSTRVSQWNRPLTATRLQVHTILNGALKKAVRLRLLATNPVAAVDRPKQSKDKGPTWNFEEISRFVDATRDTKLWPLYLLALIGVSQGEALALHWSEVDLKAGTVRVAYNLVEQGNKILGRFEVKREARNRTLALPQVLIEALTALKAKSTGEAVFTTATGTYYKKTNVIWRFKRDCVLAKVPAINFHGMRHANVSALLARGVDPKTVQAQVGHATADMTMNVYAHQMDEQKLTVARVQNGILGGR